MRLKDLLANPLDWNITANIVDESTLRLDFPSEQLCDSTINVFMCSIVLKALDLGCDRIVVYCQNKLCIDCDLGLGMMLILRALEKSWSLPAYFPSKQLTYTPGMHWDEDTEV
ncbi:MAG: hypothetical protein AAFY20_26560 [Cyanobacteria bacterium J06639_14]